MAKQFVGLIIVMAMSESP